jgi:hypothetical protein
VSKRRKFHGFEFETGSVCHLHELAPKKSCAQRPSRRVHVSPELLSKGPFATPLTRMASAKTLDLSRPFATTKPKIELTVWRATPPRHVMLCYVYTNARKRHVQPAMLCSQPFCIFRAPRDAFSEVELRKHVPPRKLDMHTCTEFFHQRYLEQYSSRRR